MSVRVPPEQVLSYYESHFRARLRPNSEGWATVKSPFREDHNASFGVNLHHGGFRDHATNVTGSIFDFEMRLTGCDFRTAKARILGESSCNEFPTAKGAPQTRQTGTRATVESLAQAKKLPLDFLRSFGLENQSQGVFIPYRLADNSPAPRHRIRAFMEHVKSPPWCYWTPGPGEIVPYGLWRLAEARKAGLLVLPEGESDCWTIWFHNFPALGIPGADMVDVLKAEYLAGIPKIYIFKELDPASGYFVQALREKLKEIGWAGETRVLSLAPIKDPSELHCANPEKFKATFQVALDGAVDAAK
jgi:putative DNA primase/helicase